MPAFVHSEACNGNGVCITVCPVDAITMKDGKALIDPEICIDCGACVDACPVKAITMEIEE